MARNGRTIWCVRAIPKWTRASERRRVTSLPRKRTRPWEARIAPEITAKSVDLPAPLGPMMPKMCRSGTRKLTSFKAATRPKCFVRPATGRIDMQSPQYPTQESDQSVRLEHDNQPQQQAVKQQMALRKHRYQLLFHD